MKFLNPLNDVSYRPEEVAKAHDRGEAIVDIVTAKRSDPDLYKWVEHFKKVQFPIFGMKYPGKLGVIKLWCVRTTDMD